MGQIAREMLLEGIEEADKQLEEERKLRRRLIGEWEQMRAQPGEAGAATRKRLELIGCMRRMNDLRARRLALWNKLEEGGGKAAD